MTNAETNDKAAAVAEQGATAAPQKASSKKGARQKKGAPKAKKTAKGAAPKKQASKEAAPKAAKPAVQAYWGCSITGRTLVFKAPVQRDMTPPPSIQSELCLQRIIV